MTHQPTHPEQAPAPRRTRGTRWWPDYPLLKPRPTGKPDTDGYLLPPRPGVIRPPHDERNA